LIYRTTRFGKAVAQSFFTLGEADYIRDLLTDKVTEDNPPADPVIIAMHLEEFNNVYVTKRMIADLKTESQGNLGSNNLFSTSVLSMTGAEHMGKKGRRIPRGVFDTIIKWQEDIFNCNCEEKPYCECGKLNVAGYILDYRLSGLNFNQIAQTLKDVYEIKVFLGDLMDYIESIIYDLLAIEKIGKALDIPRETQEKIKEIPHIVDLLVKGPKGNHVDQGVLIDQRKHQKKKYGKKSKKK